MASQAITKRKTEIELGELETSTRAERRKTRRTQRITQWLDSGSVEQHQKITFDDDESDGSSVDENLDVESLPDSIPDQLTWRGRMQVELHSQWFHIAIVLFVALDAFIVLFELLLDVGAFSNIKCRGETSIERAEFCHFDRQEDVCSPHARLLLEGRNISESPGGIGEDGLCTCKFLVGKRVCAPANSSNGINPALALHGGSLAILCIFMIEIILKLIAFRLKYFTHKFEVFDGIIVVVSFVLDIASLREEEAFEAASLLIVLRLWRVVRIVNGAILSSKAQSDQQLKEAREQGRKLIHALHKCQDRMDDTEDEVARLRRKVREREHKDGVRIKRSHEAAVPYIKVDDHDDNETEAAVAETDKIHIRIDPDPGDQLHGLTPDPKDGDGLTADPEHGDQQHSTDPKKVTGEGVDGEHPVKSAYNSDNEEHTQC